MADDKKNPKFHIIPMPNRPYYSFTDFTPKKVDGIVNSKDAVRAGFGKLDRRISGNLAN